MAGNKRGVQSDTSMQMKMEKKNTMVSILQKHYNGNMLHLYLVCLHRYSDKCDMCLSLIGQ